MTLIIHVIPLEGGGTSSVLKNDFPGAPGWLSRESMQTLDLGGCKFGTHVGRRDNLKLKTIKTGKRFSSICQVTTQPWMLGGNIVKINNWMI